MGAQIVIWAFYDQVVKVEKGWVEQEFVLLIIQHCQIKQGCQMSIYPTGYLDILILMPDFNILKVN